jgi:hypothetical protein
MNKVERLIDWLIFHWTGGNQVGAWGIGIK